MLTSSFPAVLVDVAAYPKELSASQLGQLEKNPPKTRFKKFVKMTQSYLSLQQFDKFWI
jgi:hypothetical protein